MHHVFRPDNSVQILEVGASIPWHACALGKAIAAFVPATTLDHLLGAELAPLTGRTATEPDAIVGSLHAIAIDGIALEDQEAVVGEGEIAAPVFDTHGHPVGAIGTVGPVELLVVEGEPSPTIAAAVRETARGLSRDMGAVRLVARGGAGGG